MSYGKRTSLGSKSGTVIPAKDMDHNEMMYYSKKEEIFKRLQETFENQLAKPVSPL